MSRFVPLSLAVIGLLLFLPGVSLFVSTMHDLNPEDVAAAQTPVAIIPLDQVGKQPSTVADVRIPDSAQWKRIRRDWGDPGFIASTVSSELPYISTVSSERLYFAYCMADLGMRIEIAHHGKAIPIEDSDPAYGYSTDCKHSSVKFRTAPGAELQMTISRSGQRPLPPGELIVVAKWPYEKDKIVGDELDRELRPFLAGASILGLALVAVAVMLVVRR